MGILVGTNFTNLGKSRDLGAPVASIGGGTFDGSFLAGMLGVILALAWLASPA